MVITRAAKITIESPDAEPDKDKDYVDVLDTNNSVRRNESSIRPFNHQIYTFKQSKIALTSFYDKMQMIDKVNCVPYGYNPTNEIPETSPVAEPNEEEECDVDVEMLVGIMKQL